MLLCVLSVILFAARSSGGFCPSEEGLPSVERNWDWLTYCDGTPSWITWQGTYRGTWFHLEDFHPGVEEAWISCSEFWFYHHNSVWDTSHAYFELWTGEASGPGELLDRQSGYALHYAPTYITYGPPLEVPFDFWTMVNTTFSTGGWPSSLTDGADLPQPHSFFSDDFVLWEPWEPVGRNSSYFIYVQMNMFSMNSCTWGSLKTLF